MTPAEALRAAKELIADESRWCQMGFALAADGGTTEPVSPFARRWCAAGAVLCVSRCATSDVTGECAAALDALTRAAEPDTLWMDADDMIGVIADVNDRSGKKDRRPDLAFKAVHKMYDKAIELAEAGA